jgi:hypothetical protein
VGLLLTALAVMPFHVMALIDPSATKAADDGDPFGEPPSRIRTAVLLTLTVSVGMAGAALITKKPAT